jgi:O-antigen/teichoic acid export membrane protein
MKPLRDLLKHSTIYALGQILTRIASILLLPLYTHCLTPSDYGITAIMDLTGTILSLMISGGMVTAVMRFHFDHDSREHHDQLWWTGLTYLTGVSVIVLLPLWMGRQMLSDITLGTEIRNGSMYYSYTLATIFVQVAGQFADGYLRVRKWSGIFVLISMGRLFVNVCLNVWLLVGKQMGVEGLLLGNLLASCVHTFVLMLVFAAARGPWQFCFPLALKMVRFSTPLMVTALLAMLMHEADRYILRTMVSMEDVGVYALAHKIGFAVNTLCLMPFASIWHVAIYDIDRMPKSNEIFSRIFGWFVSGMGILLLGAALTVHPILPLLTPDTYGNAIDLIAVILLGFLCFGLQLQFEVPAMLAKKTGLLIPGSIAGVTVNVLANTLLIPRLGLWGAASAGVLTYSAFSFTTLFMCRGLRPIVYPWSRSISTVAGLCTSYVVMRYLLFPQLSIVGQLVCSVVCCGLWAILLFGRDGLAWWATRSEPTAAENLTAKDQETVCEDRALCTT